MTTYQRQDNASQEGSHNLRNTDGTVEEPEVSTHVAIALQGIRDERERHGKHCSPSTTDHQERDELQILVADERYECKADTTNHQTDGISQLPASWKASLEGSVVFHTTSAMAPVV